MIQGSKANHRSPKILRFSFRIPLYKAENSMFLRVKTWMWFLPNKTWAIRDAWPNQAPLKKGKLFPRRSLLKEESLNFKKILPEAVRAWVWPDSPSGLKKPRLRWLLLSSWSIQLPDKLLIPSVLKVKPVREDYRWVTQVNLISISRILRKPRWARRFRWHSIGRLSILLKN